MTESATMQAMRMAQEEADKRRLFLSYEKFVSRYAPSDPNEAARFTARLAHLMNDAAREAQRPFVVAAAQAIASDVSVGADVWKNETGE